MDTRYWGPDAWDLFHMITLSFPEKPTDRDQEIHRLFFSTLPYILPCHYCRKSITKYLEILPIQTQNQKSMIKWMWQLHNLVNDKLRKQKLIDYSNPPLSVIKRIYLPKLRDINAMDCANMAGWKLLYSIVFTFKNDFEKMDLTRKINNILFFNMLAYVIPFPKFKLIYNDYLFKNKISKFWNHPEQLIDWIYNLEKIVSEYTVHICPKLETRELIGDKYKTGCGKKTDLAPTCRNADVEDHEIE